jgi:type IV pilus assembly protein PilA
MKKTSGFTLIEIMAVVIVIGILGAIAIPSYMTKIVRQQVESAIPLADIAKQPVALSWQLNQTFPADNAAAGLPTADKIVNNYISSVALQDGAIHITFGNHAHSMIKGKMLTLRPAVVKDAPVVPVTWVCAGAEPPNNMTVNGIDLTTVNAGYLPSICRTKGK